MKASKIIVTGKVQGVGFRYFVYKLAKKLDVQGTVRNLGDGSVEIVCQTDDLELFMTLIKEGNGYSKVDELHVESVDPDWMDSKHFRKFSIK